MAFSSSGTRSSAGLEPQILAVTPKEVVVLKPPGMPAQADETGDLDMLRWAETQLKEKLHLVHRIDRPVGGVMLFARGPRSAAEWTRRFKNSQVRKTYLAITEPEVYPPFGELRHYIEKDAKRHRAKVYYKPQATATLAILRYQTLAAREGKSLVVVEPQTGRFHQIRAQLAELGSPILGDVKYGYPPPAPDPRSIALWAWKLENWSALPPLHTYPWSLFPELASLT